MRQGDPRQGRGRDEVQGRAPKGRQSKDLGILQMCDNTHWGVHAAAAIMDEVVEEVNLNFDYYIDMIKFNLFNGK
jgi:hypothetical protein